MNEMNEERPQEHMFLGPLFIHFTLTAMSGVCRTLS